MGDLVWNVLRVGAFFMVVPIFGNRLVSRRIRMALSFAVALALTPMLPIGLNLADFDFAHLTALITHIVFSLGLGFSAAIFFQLFVVAGQFIGMQMGLGFAAMVDPGNGVQVTVWSQFFLMLVTLSFLAINGHLLLLEILIRGYQIIPPLTEVDLPTFSYQLVLMGGWMFMGGVLMAIPAVIALLIVNLAFGIMNRSAPQLNVFALGFPFRLIFGIIVIWMLLDSFSDQFLRLVDAFFDLVMTMGPLV